MKARTTKIGTANIRNIIARKAITAKRPMTATAKNAPIATKVLIINDSFLCNAMGLFLPIQANSIEFYSEVNGSLAHFSKSSIT